MSKKLLANVSNTVVDNYRRYYQEYEGTFITATNKSEDDTLDTSRYIEVTEIWGNTVQDENNLEDIQSIGELYVDEQGEPILDELGREQYKIEIESCNNNLFDEEWVMHPTMNNKVQSKNYIEVYDNLSYITNNMNSWYTLLGYRSLIAQCYDKNYSRLGQVLIYASAYRPFTLLKNTKYIKFDLDGSLENIDKIYCQLNIGSVLGSYTPHQSHKTTILLPCQLQKVGNVYDRLYWDSEKGKYVVEKNINEYHITNLSIKNNPEVNENVARIDLLRKENIGMTNVKNGGGVIVSNSLKERTYYTDRNSVDCQYTFNNDAGGSWIGFVLPPQFNTNSLFINELVDKNTKFLCQVNTPQLIETNITEKILLLCYEEKTHIFVNSTIDASMKVLVPYKEKQLTPVMDGLICWLDGRDGIVGDTWIDRVSINNINGITWQQPCKGSIYFSDSNLISKYMLNEFNNTNLTLEICYKYLTEGGGFSLGYASINNNSIFSVLLPGTTFCEIRGNLAGKCRYSFTGEEQEVGTILKQVFTINNTTSKIYNNYVNAVSFDDVNPNITNYLTLGRTNANVGGEILIYYIRIYNRALTEEEIQQNYLYEQSIKRGE